MRRGRLGTGALLVVCAIFAFAVPAAYADNGTDAQGYPCATQPAGPGQGSQCTTPKPKPKTAVVAVHKTVQPPPAGGVEATRTSGTLPFTGLQLTVFALVGLGLVAGGLLLRSTGRRRSES